MLTVEKEIRRWRRHWVLLENEFAAAPPTGATAMLNNPVPQSTPVDVTRVS